MNFYTLEAEVSGQWGANTVADSSCHPPIVTKFHYEFDDWLGDSIVESFPCYIVIPELAYALETSDLSGFSLDSVEITKSDQFSAFCPEVELPKFLWLKVNGRPGVDDLGINEENILVLSDKCFNILKEFIISSGEISKIHS